MKQEQSQKSLLYEEIKRQLDQMRADLCRPQGDEAQDVESNSYSERIHSLFENEPLRDWVFGPFRAIFSFCGPVSEAQIRSTITSVALANAFMASLPGKLGVGVLVSMALESYMALQIAKHLGVRGLLFPKEPRRLLATLGGTTLVIFFLFRQFLGFAFSLFSIVGFLPATFLAELAVTNFVGVLFWVGYKEVLEERPFSIPKRSVHFLLKESMNLLKHQWSVLKRIANKKNIKTVARRLKAWLLGDLSRGPGRLSDDVFVPAAMASVVAKDFGVMKGPVGEQFLHSIRDLYPVLQEADEARISEYFQEFDEAQMRGAMSQIKGRLHERIVELVENSDGDVWSAQIHEDPYYPSTDIVFENSETGESYAVSLKATDQVSYVEHALARYPEDPVMVTDEVAGKMEEDDRVFPSGVRNEHLNEVTQNNFDHLLERAQPSHLDVATGVVGGTALASAVTLWPFVAAWMKGAITMGQVEEASKKILGSSGKRLIPRLVGALAFGPLYLWYAMARGIMTLSKMADEGSSS
jgi:hypothetical protein